MHKDGQFVLCQYESNGVLRFQFTDTNNVIHTYDSDPGLLKVGGRHFVVISYDGVNSDDSKKGVYMYMNGHLHKFFPQTGNPHVSSNKIYLGVGYHGPLTHCMFWTRRLVDQEVLELYFFPLNRVVQSRGGGDELEVAELKRYFNSYAWMFRFRLSGISITAWIFQFRLRGILLIRLMWR